MYQIQGGCQCGAVRYTVALTQLIGYTCHCLECKKQTSSSFAISVPVPAAKVAFTGARKAYARSTDSGTTTNCFFCPSCGTRLYHQSARSPEFVTLKGGTLDHPEQVPIVAHLWTKRKADWIALPEGIEQYETQPADITSWRTQMLQQIT